MTFPQKIANFLFPRSEALKISQVEMQIQRNVSHLHAYDKCFYSAKIYAWRNFDVKPECAQRISFSELPG